MCIYSTSLVVKVGPFFPLTSLAQVRTVTRQIIGSGGGIQTDRECKNSLGCHLFSLLVEDFPLVLSIRINLFVSQCLCVRRAFIHLCIYILLPNASFQHYR